VRASCAEAVPTASASIAATTINLRTIRSSSTDHTIPNHKGLKDHEGSESFVIFVIFVIFVVHVSNSHIF
jgi:hypothetical protein